MTDYSDQRHHAKIAQLVEHNLAKVGVAGSSPVFRSNKTDRKFSLDFVLSIMIFEILKKANVNMHP